MPSMTPCAQVHLAIAREVCWIQDRTSCRRRRFRFLQFDMFSSRAMTLFAADAQRESRGAVLIDRRRQSFKVRGMTLQATRNNLAVEVGKAIAVAGAVDPSQPGPIGNRQLKELVVAPVQVGWPFSPEPTTTPKRSEREFVCAGPPATAV